MSEMEEDLQYITKLEDAESYLLWKFQIHIFLQSRSLLGYAMGSEKRPESDDDAVKEWDKNDAKAKLIIIKTCSKKVLIQIHVMSLSTSANIYSKLKSIYEKDVDYQKRALLTQLYSYQFQPSISITKNIHNVEKLVVKLKALGEPVSDENVVAKIISILPEDYSSIVAACEAHDNDGGTLKNFMELLATFENQENIDLPEREESEVLNPSSAFSLIFFVTLYSLDTATQVRKGVSRLFARLLEKGSLSQAEFIDGSVI